MPHVVKIQKTGGDYEFAITPLVEPSITAIVDQMENTVLGYRETWTVKGSVTAATQALLITAYEALLAAIDARPTYVKFEDGSSNVIDKIDAATHDAGPFVEISGLSSPTGGAGWFTNHFSFTMKVSGDRYLDAVTRQLSYSIRYAYDDAQLLTKTKSGTIRTAPGTSAQTKAEAQAWSGLASTYVLANGPKGEIEVLDTADTQARFNFVAREIGKAVPAGLTSYEERTEESKRGGEVRTVKTVRGRGTSTATVKAALLLKKPGGDVASQTVRIDETSRSVEIIFETREPESGDLILWRETVTITGGNKPRIFTPLTGDLKPFAHTGRLRPVRIEEAGTIVSKKEPILLPPMLFPAADLVEHQDGRTEIAETRAPDDPQRFQRGYRRTYEVVGVDAPGLIDTIKRARNRENGLLTVEHTLALLAQKAK